MHVTSRLLNLNIVLSLRLSTWAEKKRWAHDRATLPTVWRGLGYYLHRYWSSVWLSTYGYGPNANDNKRELKHKKWKKSAPPRELGAVARVLAPCVVDSYCLPRNKIMAHYKHRRSKKLFGSFFFWHLFFCGGRYVRESLSTDSVSLIQLEINTGSNPEHYSHLSRTTNHSLLPTFSSLSLFQHNIHLPFPE